MTASSYVHDDAPDLDRLSSRPWIAAIVIRKAAHRTSNIASTMQVSWDDAADHPG